MKKIHLILVILIGIYAQGQDTLTKQTPKFRIGIFTSADFNLADKNYPTSSETGFVANYNHFNYSVGFTGEYSLTEKLSLNTGLNYSNKHFTGLLYCHVCDLFSVPTTTRLQYFEIPISVRFYLPLNQVSIFTEVGSVNQFAQSNFIQFIDTTENGYVFGMKLGAGIELKLNESIALQFGAEYLKGITNLLSYVDVKSESVGIKLGLVKSF